MDKAIKEKANKWLNSNIDQDAKDEIMRIAGSTVSKLSYQLIGMIDRVGLRLRICLGA